MKYAIRLYETFQLVNIEKQYAQASTNVPQKRKYNERSGNTKPNGGSNSMEKYSSASKCEFPVRLFGTHHFQGVQHLRCDCEGCPERGKELLWQLTEKVVKRGRLGLQEACQGMHGNLYHFS